MKLFAYILLISFLLYGCGSDTPVVKNPVANAGEDFNAFVGEVVNLDSSASFSPDKQLTTFEWLIDGNIVSRSPNYQTVHTEEGNYTYTLRVYDSSGRANDDQVVVSVSLKALNHLLYYGQSLSIGANGLDIITTEQAYNNLTFRGGPRSDLDEVDAFKPLVEDADLAPDGRPGRGETLSSSSGNMITRLIELEDFLSYEESNFDMLVSTAGHGGYRIDQLNRQSAWYQYLIAHVQGGFVLSESQDRAYELKAVAWLQGESDVTFTTTKALYKAELKQLRADIEYDANAITNQTSLIPLITYQVAWNSTLNSKIALAHIETSEEDPNIYIATPMYHLPYSLDKVHLTNIGYAWAGHYFGRAFKRIVYDGLDWKPTSPIQLSRTGPVIDIEFNVPEPPLVIDEVTLGEIENSGFVVLDNLNNSIEIESIQVFENTKIRIVLQNDLVGPLTVRYGLDNSSSIIDNNIESASGGQLRDSSTDNWRFNGENYPLWNWSVMFEREVN